MPTQFSIKSSKSGWNSFTCRDAAVREAFRGIDVVHKAITKQLNVGHWFDVAQDDAVPAAREMMEGLTESISIRITLWHDDRDTYNKVLTELHETLPDVTFTSEIRDDPFSGHPILQVTASGPFTHVHWAYWWLVLSMRVYAYTPMDNMRDLINREADGSAYVSTQTRELTISAWRNWIAYPKKFDLVYAALYMRGPASMSMRIK